MELKNHEAFPDSYWNDDDNGGNSLFRVSGKDEIRAEADTGNGAWDIEVPGFSGHAGRPFPLLLSAADRYIFMNPEFHIGRYDYHLPPEQIAQYPARDRDSSKLLLLDRKTDAVSHEKFQSILKFLKKGDCLIINNSRVFPARITGRKPTGGRIEFFLLHYPEKTDDSERARALALYRSSKSVKTGQIFDMGPGLKISTVKMASKGQVLLDLFHNGNLDDALRNAGRTPLPPYIKRRAEALDIERYQTVYASSTGSVAAPTAGLHFTKPLLDMVEALGVKTASVTLHVGYGTFAPVRCEDIRKHSIHSEWIEISDDSARIIRETQKRRGRLIAVGTTSVRTLEFVQQTCGEIRSFSGNCDLYIIPGYEFRVVKGMITNFHLPMSSLLLLVSAFAGRKRILSAYREAVKMKYRFYSYGDAMFII